MRKLKIYLETTVFNRYFEPGSKHHEETLMLFEEIAAGKFEVYTSAYVIEELMNAPEPKRQNMLDMITRYGITLIEGSVEAEALAKEYVTYGILSEKHFYDRTHIACASVSKMDMIVSLNFAHINRPKTRKLTRSVNELKGYAEIAICSPMEVIEDEE